MVSAVRPRRDSAAIEATDVGQHTETGHDRTTINH